MPDPVAALVTYLQGAPVISGLVLARVYGGELPRDDAFRKAMPQACLVLVPAGGGSGFGGGYQQFGDERLDVFAYADTKHASYQLYNAVRDVLKNLHRVVAAETLVHWCRRAGGPISLRDPDMEWPFTLSSWQVLASEVPAT